MKKWVGLITLLIVGLFVYIEANTKDINTNNTNKDQKNEIINRQNLVSRVIDGDTFELDNKQKVRLIGIDAPEVSGGAECFGNQATERLKQLIEGREVRLEKDVSETDKYGRLLRFVYVGDVFVNKTVIEEGYANALTYPPDVREADNFKNLERMARAGRKGLWGTCVGPTQVLGAQSFTCDCAKGCKNMTSCEEAQYQLTTCGCKARDGDGDGVACNGEPLRC